MAKAEKQYLVRFGSAMLIYVIVLPLAIILSRRIDPSPWRYALMLLPTIPIFAAMLAFLRYFESMDELQKRIQLYALAVSAGGTAVFGMTYGMLEVAGLPHLLWIWVFPIVVGLWGLGTAIASRRYR